MAYDVRAAAASLTAELVLGQVEATVAVNEAILLDGPVVASATGFATAVVGATHAFAQILADSALSAHLDTCVAVIAGGPAEPDLTARLAGERITTIYAPDHTVEIAHLTVAARIATDQAAEDRRVTTGTKVLTQVARRGGVVAVVAEMAHRIDGWAVLLDSRGEVITTAGAGGSLHVRDAVAVAFHRPVRIRHTGLQVHPVGHGEDISAYLVIGARGPTSRSRDLASQAAALLDLLLRTADNPATERLGREVMVTTLLRGGGDAAALLRRWGVHETSLTAFAVASRSRTIDPRRWQSAGSTSSAPPTYWPNWTAGCWVSSVTITRTISLGSWRS